MKSVLMSLKPYYYYLIGEGIKTIEVRKSLPKDKDWDKNVYFYMSKDEKSFAKIPKEYQEKYRKHFGKVGLKFVCDRIEGFVVGSLGCDDIEKDACLSYGDMIKYFYKPNEIDGKTAKRGCGWHISNLVMWYIPKKLNEFRKYYECGKNSCAYCNKCDEDWHLTRPPQSWIYVKEMKI